MVRESQTAVTCEMGEPKIIHSARDPGNTWDLLAPEGEPTRIYADGLAGLALATSMSKLMLYRQRLDMMDTGPEQRELAFEIAMPTESLVDLCTTVLTALAGNLGRIEASLGPFVDKLRHAVETHQAAPARDNKS
jgi:hypothetical protein